jgi:tetratricopeptide (TPR) repeat protein
MKKLLFILLITNIIVSINAQSYNKLIKKFYLKNDRDSVFICLENWQKEQPDNADMYLAMANYYLEESQTNVSETDTINNPEGRNDLVHINNSIFYLAQETIVEGIKKNPNRIDLYRWRFSTLTEKGEIYDYTDEIVNFIETDSIIKSKWLSQGYLKIHNSRDYFISHLTLIVKKMAKLRGYANKHLHKIMLKLLSSYPQYIHCNFFLGMIESGNGNWTEAIEYFSACYNMASNIVINYKTYNRGEEYSKPIYAFHLAEAYFETKNYDKALKYYRKAKHGTLSFKHKDIAKIRIKYLKDKLKELKDKDAA